MSQKPENKGFTPQPSNPNQTSSSQPAMDQASGTSQKSEGDTGFNAPVDVRMQGMQRIARTSLRQFVSEFERLEGEYFTNAQVIADQVSQGLFDMATNRRLYSAIESNLSVLMDTVETGESVSVPKLTLKPRSFKLLQPETVSSSLKPALKPGK